MKNSRAIKVAYLARVEGEGGLTVKIKDGEVKELKLNIFEPPRFFEAFLQGRNYWEAPDITARICGICPIAYMMSSSCAMESAFGKNPGGQIRELRRLIYFGEWIESHALHVFMLHAPDFTGYQDAVQLAKDRPDLVKMGLELKKIGNDLVIFLGGREIHPVNCKVGGFYKVPEKKDLIKFVDRLKWARNVSYDTIRWLSTLPFPEFEKDYVFVALRHPEEYAVLDGRLVSNKGLDIDISEYETYFKEEHVEHSTSLHAMMKDQSIYKVGPMARFNLNYDKLSPLARKAAREVGLGPTCFNPFKSIIIRGIEILHACDESLKIIKKYQMPEQPSLEIIPRSSTGYGCTEAPRGICWHKYDIDEKGIIKNARIVAPTSQNQKSIEDDLLHFVKKNMNLPQEKLTWMCEQVVRNYDPCISCSCHSLKVKIART